MFDPLESAANRAKAQVARAAKIAFINANFKLKWMDEPLWLELAEKHKIKLPGWYAKLAPRIVSKWSKSLGEGDFQTVYGCSAKRLLELNPRQPLRAFVGQMLERLG